MNAVYALAAVKDDLRSIRDQVKEKRVEHKCTECAKMLSGCPNKHTVFDCYCADYKKKGADNG
jgi:hypothetical protein